MAIMLDQRASSAGEGVPLEDIDLIARLCEPCGGCDPAGAGAWKRQFIACVGVGESLRTHNDSVLLPRSLHDKGQWFELDSIQYIEEHAR
jgi:hypothetical protein